MRLETRVNRIRDAAIAQGRAPVPEHLQGVIKARVAAALRALDLETRDCVDAVFALLDDQTSSWFSGTPADLTFSHGATIAHIACHVGILQRGGTKLDREGRDYWIKPLRNIGAVETVFFDRKSRKFLPGHPVAKSPNSAYRLTEDFKLILQSPEPRWMELLMRWAEAERIRERLAFQAARAIEVRGMANATHADLIDACIAHYVPRFLPGFEVIYVDASDGDRIDAEDRERLSRAGLGFELGDAMPDILLHNRELNELWVIEAVSSDGEVDDHKVRGMVAFATRHRKDGVGFTTAYATWKAAAQRQAAHKNIPPSTYVWIRDDPSKHYRAEEFGTGGARPSTIRSKPS